MRVFSRIAACAAIVLACLPARADEESAALRLYRDGIDRAVDRALAWMAAEQRPDGTFPVANGATNALVGLAGMAFLAAGHTPGRPPYGEVLNRCTDHLLRRARADGYMGADAGRMYGHGIATLYLSEVEGMLDPARDEQTAPLLARALRLILDAQKVPKHPAFGEGLPQM